MEVHQYRNSIPMQKNSFFLGLIILFSNIIHSEEAAKKKPVYKPTLAVNELEGRGITRDEAATLTDILRNDLLNTGRFQVMERGKMEEILKEQAFQHSGTCNEEACLVEIGQLLGIEQLAAGSIGKVGKAYSINIRIISVQTGEIVKTTSHNYSGPIEDLLTHEMNVVAKKIAGIEPQVEEKISKRKKGPIILAGAGLGLALVGGGVAYLIISNKDDEEPAPENADVIMDW